MSEQTGGAKIDEIHTLATDGFTHLMGDELKTTAQVAKQLVKDIKGNPDKRVNNLATQLNKDADELIKILGGPAAPSTGLFSGFSGIFGSKTATPSPSPAPPPPSISTTPASGPAPPPSITTTSASGPPAPPPPSGSSSAPPPSGKKEYENTRNWLQGIDKDQRLQRNLVAAMNTVLTEPTDTNPKLENARNILLNKRKEIEGLKGTIETKDRDAKEDFINKVKEYTESFAAYNKSKSSLNRGSWFTRKNRSTTDRPETPPGPSMLNRFRQTMRRKILNPVRKSRDPALNRNTNNSSYVYSPEDLDTLSEYIPKSITADDVGFTEDPSDIKNFISNYLNRPAELRKPPSEITTNSGTLLKGTSQITTFLQNIQKLIDTKKTAGESEPSSGRFKEEDIDLLDPKQIPVSIVNSFGKTINKHQEITQYLADLLNSKDKLYPLELMYFVDNKFKPFKFSEAIKKILDAMPTLIEENKRKADEKERKREAYYALKQEERKRSSSTVTPRPSSLNVGTQGSSSSSAAGSNLSGSTGRNGANVNGPSSGSSSAASSNLTGRNGANANAVPSGNSSSSSSGSNQSGPAQRKSTSSNRSSSSSSGGPPYNQGSLSQTGGPAPYVAPSNPLQTGLNASREGFVKRRAQLLQESAAQQKTPTIVVPQTRNPAYGIQGIQRYTNPKGGARHTRKYSKKQANRQTRRG